MALHFIGDKLHEAVSVRPDAGAWQLEGVDGTPLPTGMIGA